MSPQRTRWHEAAYRLLLRAYPRAFRDRYEEEMVLLFRRRLERAESRRGRAALWWRMVRDTASNARSLKQSDGGTMQMGTMMQDLRYAVRHLVRSPVFTLGATALLAVGIGANTTVFTMVDALLFRPPPWERPEEVVHVYQHSDDGEPSSSSFPAYRDMATSDAFASVAATTPSSATWEGPDGPVPLQTEYTTASYMEVLGLSPIRGRWFGPEHDQVGGPPAAVITETAWRTRFGSDPGIVGSTLRLNGEPVVVIGVGPEKLVGTFGPLKTDLWLSISTTHLTGQFQVNNLERRADHWYDVRARLAPGVTVTQARAAMDALALRLAEEYPEYNRGRDISVFASTEVRLHPQADGDLFLVGSLLSAVVATILLLACANLANLLLVRGLGRSGEMAVRRALGAGRTRVVRLFLVESILLSVLGGGLGLLAARWAVGVIPTLPLDLPGGGTLTLAIDSRVILFTAAVVGATGVLFGLAPALKAARTDVALALRDDRRTSSDGRGVARLRKALVGVQVGASLVLVLGTGLMARSLMALQNADTGVDVDRVGFVRAGLNSAGLSGDEGRVVLGQILERVMSSPGIEAAAATSRLPAAGGGSTTTEVEGYTPPTGTEAVEMDFAIVTDGYFETMGITLLAGRSFGPDDLPDGGASIVVNETSARQFYGSAEAALGRRMRGQGSETWTRTVVGVAEDTPTGGLGDATDPMFYYSSRQVNFLPEFIVVRTDGDAGAVLAPTQTAVADIRPSVVVSRRSTLTAHFGDGLAGSRLAAGMMGAFSLLALILASLGIYAVVSFSVARRSAELGIRMALGAERGSVVGMVVRDVSGTVIVGLAAGVVLSWLAASRLEGLLYGVSALDPVAFVGSVLLLLAVGGLAAWLPARRAAGTDPVETLRSY